MITVNRATHTPLVLRICRSAKEQLYLAMIRAWTPGLKFTIVAIGEVASVLAAAWVPLEACGRMHGSPLISKFC
jgi:hypothetical protein